MKKSDPPIITTETFNVRPARLWQVITEAADMRQWYFPQIEEFRPEVGFATSFTLHSGDRRFTHRWQVLEVVSKSRLVYSWNYVEYPGDSTVTFAIKETKDGCALTVETTIEEDFPQDIQEFDRASGVAGWQYLIQTSLKQYLT